MYSIVDLLVIGSFLLLASIIADFFGACNTVDFSRDATDLLHERPCRLLASPSRGTGDEANLQPVTEPPLEESVQTPSSFSIPTPDLPPLDDSLILGLLAQQTSTRADNPDILAYFEKHPDLASRSEFCRTSYKQIYTQLYVGKRMAGFIRHDQYLELWEGNYLTKTAQSDLT